MKNFLFTGIIGVTVTVSPFVSLESPAIAITLRGTFDWETTNQPTTSSGNTVFLFDDNAIDEGIIEFNVTSGIGSGVVFPFSIDSASFTPNSSLEILTFSDSDGNNGTLDLISLMSLAPLILT